MVEEMVTLIFVALAGLGCLGSAALVLISPETLDVDKIFAVIVCLLFALVFFGFAAWMLLNTKLRTLWQQPAAAAPAPSDKKAPAAKAD